jgi:hypothetical protein
MSLNILIRCSSNKKEEEESPNYLHVWHIPNNPQVFQLYILFIELSMV